MKKLLFLSFIAFLAFSTTQAQEPIRFGVTGGLLNTNVDFKTGNSLLNLVGVENYGNINNTGFYVGALLDIAATDKFHVQPELTYGKSEDLSFVYLPIMAKYYVAPKFHIQAGPQLNFSSNLDDIKNTIRDAEELLGTNGDVDDVLRTVGVDLGVGAGFDVTENFTIQARYSFELTDRYNGPAGGVLDIKGSALQVGVAFMF
ncbi:porin family protein [Maribacter luteus]|uniref:Outer membrane beta-barrel protein n=1 Tax=Maribacter luteus TaxID=2594478 RepID=A0A6I2MSK0_9FLAO|nr:porin family protein [Maribacter luteus]MRX65515.1 outer membrane beta-barrel protein [Maribacter luteus]